MTTAANLYCSLDDVRDVLSSAGVNLATDDYPPNEAGNALAKAGNKIDFYLARRYDPADLATSDLVKDWAAAIAARYLRARRGNPAPIGVMDLYKEAIADLELVRKGQADIAGLALIKSHSPGMSKMRATLRPYARAVVEKSQGTHASGEAADYHRAGDPFDTFGWNNSGIMDYQI